MFVTKGGPHRGFVIKTLLGSCRVGLFGDVGATYDLDGYDAPGRRIRTSDCGKSAIADDAAERVAGDVLALVVWEGGI